MTFSPFTMLYNHHLSTKYFHPSKIKSIMHSAISPHPPTFPASSTHQSVDLSILDISHKRNHSVYGLLSVFHFACFAHLAPYRSMCQYFVPFYGRTILHCMQYTTSIRSLADGHLSCLPIWATVNSAATNMSTCLSHVFFFCFSGYILSEIAGFYGILFSHFRPTKLFSTVAEPHYIAIHNIQRFQFFHILGNTRFCLLIVAILMK